MSAAATPAGPGGADVQQLVAALGERLDDRGHARHADPQAGVERDLDLGDGGEPPVDVRVGADHLDLEAGDAALADLLERARHAVHRAEPVGDQRDPHGLAAARGEAALLAAEERGGGRVGDRRDERREQRARGSPRAAARTAAAATSSVDRGASLRSCPAGAAREVGVARSRRPAGARSARRRQVRARPRRAMLQQRACVVGREVGAVAPPRASASAMHALDHPQHGCRVGGGAPSCRARARARASAIARAPSSPRCPGRRAPARAPARMWAGTPPASPRAASRTRCARCRSRRGRRFRRRRCRRGSRRRSRPGG